MTCRHAAAAAALSMTFGLTHAQTRTFDSSSGRGASAGLAQGGLDYPIKPVPFTRVHLNDTFWAPLFASNWRCTGVLGGPAGMESQVSARGAAPQGATDDLLTRCDHAQRTPKLKTVRVR